MNKTKDCRNCVYWVTCPCGKSGHDKGTSIGYSIGECKRYKENFMELKDTTELMNSADYKDRFKAEYYQLKIRYDKLKAMVEKWDNGTLSFKPTCPREIYDIQLKAMSDYLNVLEDRAKLENVEL